MAPCNVTFFGRANRVGQDKERTDKAPDQLDAAGAARRLWFIPGVLVE